MQTPTAVSLPGEPREFQRFIGKSQPLDLNGIDWLSIPSHPLSDDLLRVLAYMQDVESHTVVFPRTIFSQRAADDPLVGTFLICWLYEEGMHGRALAKFLDCAGHNAECVASWSASMLRSGRNTNRTILHGGYPGTSLTGRTGEPPQRASIGPFRSCRDSLVQGFSAIGSSGMCTPNTAGSVEIKLRKVDGDHRTVTETYRFRKGN